LRVAFALLVKCATATHPHSGWATPALLSTPTNAMTPAKSKTLNPTMTSKEFGSHLGVISSTRWFWPDVQM
jgi:hypothetical protein